MRTKVTIFFAIIVLVGIASNAWSQNPITADSPFQVRYLANLNIGDSFVNIVNTGANGAPDPAGKICANVYVFSPDEVMAACCTCLVTSNGLMKLSAQHDLISNTLTPAVPTSIVVKLLASLPVGGSCNAATPGALAVGMLAWGTTLHKQTATSTTPNTNPTCSYYCPGGTPLYPYLASYCASNCAPVTSTTTTYMTTETPFSPATLSAGELTTLTSKCAFIQTNGGYGICRSCQIGANSLVD